MKRNPRILIADDNKELCNCLTDLLELEEYDVTAVYDGNQAIEAVRKDEFAIVLMDVKMPGLNGVEATRILKEIAPRLPVVLISAFADEELHRDGLQTTDFEIIQKPIDIHRLLQRLKQIP
ncbi:MAG: response regulator [Armatimonadetes bacterium]|nr:response regulator [Armatimonadota bacterium]